MGEQVTTILGSGLFFAGRSEFDRIRSLNRLSSFDRVTLFADLCRLNTLYAVARAGSGHLGSSFSSMDVVSWLYLEQMGADDLYFSSKGHDAPGLYAILAALGRLEMEKLHGLRRLGGLPGHPDVRVPGMVVNSGSLGMGISKAKGIIKADRLSGRSRRIYVMLGDGELQEGQIWESLVSAVNSKLGELIVIVDHNKLQSDYRVDRTSDLGDLVAKFSAFGWHVERCDGHDLAALDRALKAAQADTARPSMIVADTVKGRGVSFMEHTAMESDADIYRFHSGAPDADSYKRAAAEIVERINERLAAIDAEPLTFERLDHPPTAPPPAGAERLVARYSKALLEQAARNPKIIALDADLVLDTGLIPFRDTFPDRFVECGIAEQDMVSQAGGMALQGYLPVVHSFGCFLSSRPNEQIYTNATERSKVIYVGSLNGLLPAGPGHSHQSVRDVSAMGAMPGLLVAEPCCEAEVDVLVDYALNQTEHSVYIRLVSIPCVIPYAFPAGAMAAPGTGTCLREGRDGVVIGYGPTLLPEAYRALEALAASGGPSFALYNLPWLNQIDPEWLRGVVSGMPALLTLDNHYLKGGQGEAICATLAELGLPAMPKIKRLGVIGIPESGQAQEILSHHGLDQAAIEKAIRQLVG